MQRGWERLEDIGCTGCDSSSLQEAITLEREDVVQYNSMMYQEYAAVYDASGQIRFSVLMAYYLKDLLQRHPASGQRALDIACGTGTLACILADEGWQVTGLDASTAMLAQAQSKYQATEGAANLTFVQGDIRALGHVFPPEQFNLVTCTYDSLNYLLNEVDLAACFASIAYVLAPDGLFIADMHTPYFLEQGWGTCEVLEQPGYIQVSQSQIDPFRSTATMHITGFIGDDEQGYRRFEEVHVERAYPLEVITSIFEQVGFYVEAAYDCFSFNPPCATAWRIAWVVRKPENQESGNKKLVSVPSSQSSVLNSQLSVSGAGLAL